MQTDFFSSVGRVFNSGFFTPLQLGLMGGILGLFVLLLICFMLLKKYRNQYRFFAARCADLEPKLADTSCELQEMTDESAARQRMMDDAGTAIFRLNEKGECVYVNAAMATLLGVSLRKKADRYSPLDAVHPDDRADVQESWVKFASRRPPYQSSYRLQKKGGGIVYVTERGSVLRDKKRKVTGYLGLVTDVSEQAQERSEALRAQQQSDWFIQETSAGFCKLDLEKPVPLTSSANEMAALICRHAKLAACSRGLAEFCGQPVEELVGTALKDLPDGCGFFGSSDAIRQFVDADLRMSGAEGVRTDSRDNPVCLRFDVAGIVENNQLVSIWSTQHDISGQKREQEKLKHETEFYQRILDTLPGEVFMKDPRCRFQYVSHRFESRTGIPVDDWLEKTVFEVLPAAPRDINRSSIEAMKSGRLNRTVRSRTDSGRKEWVETLEQPLVNEDGVLEGIVGITVDVTARVAQELELQKTEARFRNLVEQNPAAIMMADSASNTLTYANPAFCDLFGYTSDEITGLRVDDLHSPGSRRQVLAEWNARADGEHRFGQALSCLRKDRSALFAEVSVVSGTFDGKDCAVAVYMDAAGRRQAENELERQRDLQAGLLRSASVLAATVDSRGVIQYVNDALLELTGRNEPDLIGKPYAGMVCEEDRDWLKHAFSDNSDDRPQEVECRLEAADGTLYATVCRIRPWTHADDDGFMIAGVNVAPLRVLEQQLDKKCSELESRLAECEEELAGRTRAFQVSEESRIELAEDLRKQQESRAAEEKEFEKSLFESKKRIAELSDTLLGLRKQKSTLEEELAACRAVLVQETEQCKQATALLDSSRKGFRDEQERIEQEARRTVAGIEEKLKELHGQEQQLREQNEGLQQKLTDCEERLAEAGSMRSQVEEQQAAMQAELEKLEEALSGREQQEKKLSKTVAGLERRKAELEQELKARTAELKTRRGEWKAEKERMDGLRLKLEETSAQQADQLKRMTAERVELERELKLRSKEAASGRKAVQAQVQQSTALLKKELKDLQASEKQLKAAADKSGRRLAELEKALAGRAKELEAAVAAQKESEQLLRKTRQDLTKQLRQEKNGATKLREQTKADRAERNSAEEGWKKDRAMLVAKTQELETSLRERTHELTFAAAARQEDAQTFRQQLQELEEQIRQEKERLAGLLNQADDDTARRVREDEAKDEERRALKAQVQDLQKLAEERAEQLAQAAEERTELEARLKNAQDEADRRMQSVDELVDRKTEDLTLKLENRRELEERIRSEQKQLNEQLAEVQKTLEQRTREIEHETGERQRAEQDAARQKKAAEAGYRMVLDFANDLNGPLAPVLELSEAVLQESGLSDESRRRITEIHQCAGRLQAILAYRQELTRMEEGSVCPEAEWFDLNAFLSQLVGGFTEQSEAGKVFFAFSREGDLTGLFFADREKVERVLNALFGQVLEGMSKGQVGLHAVCEEFGARRRMISFLMMRNRGSQDPALPERILDPAGCDSDGSDRNEERWQFDLACRTARLLGGDVTLENRSDRQQLYRFTLPMDYKAVAGQDAEISGPVEEHAAVL